MPDTTETDDCRNIILEEFVKRGADVVVSTEPPIIPTHPDEQAAWVCPHGIRYYAEPTSEQVAAWRRDGVQ